MNTCERANQLNAYHDGELPPADAADLDRHVRGCPACAAELDRLRKLTHLFAAQPAAELSASALRRFHRAIDRAARNGIVRFAETFAALAALIMLVCVLSLRYHGKTTPPIAPPSAGWEQTAVSDVSADSVTTADDRLASWIVQDLRPEDAND